jgi:hypothetical protein
MSKDHDLQQAVLAALDFEPSLNAAHIGVAAATAWNTPGVIDVDNAILVA